MWTRARKAVTAIFWGHMLGAVGNLVLVPLYLTYWSPEAYGEWLVLLALAAYLSTLDMGLNMAAANTLTQAHSRGDLEDYARCQHSAFAFYLSVAVVSSILLSATLWIFPLPAWLGLKETEPREAALVMWLLGLNVLWSMPAGFIWSVYRTTGNVSKSQWIWNAQQLLGLGVIPLILVLGGGMKSVAVGQCSLLIVMVLAVLWDLKRRLPALVPGVEKARLSFLWRLFQPSLFFAFFMVSNALTLQGSVIVLSTALGGVAVAMFVTCRTLVNLVRQAGNSFITALWPEVTSLETRGEWEQLRSLHRLLMAGSSFVCVGFAAALWYEGVEIFTVWTRGKLEPDPILLRLLLVLLVLQSTWLVSVVFPAAGNRHEKVSWLYLASALIGIGAAAVLAKSLGTWAIPIGLFIGEAVTCYHLVIRDTCRLLGEAYWTFAVKLWSGMLAATGLALTTGWVAHTTIPGPFFIRWLGVGTITLTTAFVSYWSIGVTSEDRERVMSRFRPSLMSCNE